MANHARATKIVEATANFGLNSFIWQVIDDPSFPGMPELEPTGIFGKEARMQARPLHNDKASALQIIVPTQIEELVLFPDTIEIEVKHLQPPTEVFLNQRKSRTGDLLLVTQSFHNSLGKSRFPRSQVAQQSNHLTIPGSPANLMPESDCGCSIGQFDRKRREHLDLVERRAAKGKFWDWVTRVLIKRIFSKKTLPVRCVCGEFPPRAGRE